MGNLPFFCVKCDREEDKILVLSLEPVDHTQERCISVTVQKVVSLRGGTHTHVLACFMKKKREESVLCKWAVVDQVLDEDVGDVVVFGIHVTKKCRPSAQLCLDDAETTNLARLLAHGHFHQACVLLQGELHELRPLNGRRPMGLRVS